MSKKKINCDGVKKGKRAAPLLFALALILCLNAAVFAQETTGSIEVTVKDPQGAIVPNAAVTIESSRSANASTTGFRRTVTTNEDGFQRILQVPPGTYQITVAAANGFSERKLDQIDVVLGKVTPVMVEL